MNKLSSFLFCLILNYRSKTTLKSFVTNLVVTEMRNNALHLQYNDTLN